MDLKINNRNGGWGTVLITLGLIAFVDNFGISEWYKVPLLVLGGMAAFFFYYRNRMDWVTLIPVYTLWVGAVVTAGILGGAFNDDIIPIAVLPLIAFPFLFVYLKDRKKWWALIPAYFLLLIALVLLFTEVLGMGDDFIAPILMPGFAVPFLYVYFMNKERWWALIPAYVFLLVGTLITLEELFVFGDKFIAPGIVGGIGLPFLYVYFRNRDQWWALIPAYALLAIGTMIALLDFDLLRGLVVPAYIMWAIAIPFFYVYILNREKSWALIPGGIIAAMGLAFLLGTDIGKYLFPAVLVLAGVWMLVRVLKK